MPVRVIEYQPTPNPSALRCVLDAPVARTPISLRPTSTHQAPAANHAPAAATTNAASTIESRDPGPALAAQITTIPGVVGLLMHPTWLTITKAPGTNWPPIKRALESLLDSAAPIERAPIEPAP